MSRLKPVNAFLVICAAFMIAGCASMFKDGPLVDKPGEKTGTLTLVNKSNDEIRSVMIVRCSANSFLSSRNEAPVPAGRSQVFELSPGCWSMRIDGVDTKFTGDVNIVSGKNETIALDGDLR